MRNSHATSADRRADALIIGGGLHGLSTALHLSRAGARPVVLEREYPGRHASGVNAGGVRRLERHFAEVPLSVAALKLWYDLPALVDDDCGFTPCGQVLIAETEAELDSLEGRAARLTALGFDHERVIDGKELRDIVPALAKACPGALWCAEDGAADPMRTVMAFRRKAEALGAEVCQGAEVTGITQNGATWRVETTQETFEAPVVINCAGAWGGELARMIGDDAPVRAEAPMLMISERVPAFVRPVVMATGRILSFKQLANGTVLIGGGYRGTVAASGTVADVNFAGLGASARTVLALFPQLRGLRVVRSWAGIEGIMPDAIPVIGPSLAGDGAFHAFGFSAHGFQLGPVVGKLLAQLVTAGRCELEIAPFSLSRFRA